MTNARNLVLAAAILFLAFFLGACGRNAPTQPLACNASSSWRAETLYFTNLHPQRISAILYQC